MCIIVTKEKGLVLPSKETLLTCFRNNSDGAGYMFNYKGSVHIKKGYMDFYSFYEDLINDYNKFELVDSGVVMHFRISTACGVKPENTHPYPITDDIDLLKATYATTNIGVAHNGIIPMYRNGDLENGLNDTQVYVRDILSYFKDTNAKFMRNEKAMKIIEETVCSKLAFLDEYGDIYYIGDFEVGEDGIKYSNSSYMSYTFSYSGCTNHNSHFWDYYDEWDNYSSNEYDASYNHTDYAISYIMETCECSEDLAWVLYCGGWFKDNNGHKLLELDYDSNIDNIVYSYFLLLEHYDGKNVPLRKQYFEVEDFSGRVSYVNFKYDVAANSKREFKNKMYDIK